MDVFCINSVDIDYIECIRDPCLVLTVSTYIVLNALEIVMPYVDSVKIVFEPLYTE